MQKRSAKEERERGSKGKCRDIGSQKGRNEGGRQKCGENWEKAPPAAAAKFRGEARRSATRRVAILWMNIFVYVTHNVKVIKCRQKIVGFDLKFEIVVYLLFSFWTILLSGSTRCVTLLCPGDADFCPSVFALFAVAASLRCSALFTQCILLF